MENPTTDVQSIDADIKQGMAHLTGVGQPRDEAMAAACFLNAYDRGSPDGIVAASIIYFCGIGVTRDTQQAAEYANNYLIREPHGRHATSMRELVDMSLGAENAKKLLLSLGVNQKSNSPESSYPSHQNDTSQRATLNKKVIVVAAAGVVSTVLILGIVFSGNFLNYGGLPSPTTVDRLFTTDELKSAKEEAQSFAGYVRNEARQSAR